VAANRLLFDSGAVTALADGDKKLRYVVRKAIAGNIPVAVPTIVIAESTTGDRRDANVNRILREFDVLNLTESIARDAGKLRARLRGAGLADTVVVATADRVPGTTIITADVRDLRALAAIASRTAVEHI
jgi:predicted nucleic acid-binding protein